MKTQVRSFGKIIPLVTLKRNLPSIRVENPRTITMGTVDIHSILYLESVCSYTVIHLNDGKKVISPITLKRFAEYLSQDRFMRVHTSYLILKSAISCYLANQNKIVLYNAQEIPVSNSKKEGILRNLKTLVM